jgi:predicted alpha/beta superfamily hydrolase
LLPKEYESDPNSKYDVIYLLDGEDNIALLSHIQRFAQKEKHVPPLIIVAIFNTNRNRDLTPTPLKNISSSGGAANFLSFFKSELIPYISKSYPVSGENILCGHSFGGLFSMYTALLEPQLFASYILADPSFWYDGDYTNKLAIQKLGTLSGLKKTLYISGREGDMLGMGISSLDSVLKLHAPKDLLYKVVAYENETHGSVKLKSMYDGLKFAYSGYRSKDEPIDYHPMNGIVLKGKSYVVQTFGDLQELRFTTDGSIPSPTSAEMERENTFSGPVQLNIKSFTRKATYDKLAKGNFILGQAFTPVPSSDKFSPGGVSYQYFEGKWDSIPNFKKLRPSQTGIADKDFNFSKLPSKTNFALLFEGRLVVKEDGYYTFVMDADDGAKLFLKNKLLIDYDGTHSRRSSQTFLVPLKKGFYPIRLEYFQKDKGMDLRLRYLIPGSKEPIDIPTELLYSAK